MGVQEFLLRTEDKRPYTKVLRTIFTLVSLRASIRVSPDFALFSNSSLSFGSQHVRSHSNLSRERSRSVDGAPALARRIPPQPPSGDLYFHCASGVCRPNTRTYVRLLGPCFKTGDRGPFRQHPQRNGRSAGAAPRRPIGAHCIAVRTVDTRRSPAGLASGGVRLRIPRRHSAHNLPRAITAAARGGPPTFPRAF